MTDPFGAGKGDTPRPVDTGRYGENFELIFPLRTKPKLVKCGNCRGAGVLAKAGPMYGEAKYAQCPTCHGDGMVTEVTQ